MQSTSVRCGERPRPKPRKHRLVSQDTLPQESNNCDGNNPQQPPAESSPLTRTNSVPPSLNHAATYMKLDADAMMKDAQCYVKIPKMRTELDAQCYVKIPKMRTELASSTGSVRSGAGRNDELVYTTERGEDHIYTEILLPPGPPPPPPRLHALPHRPSTWHVSNRQNAFLAMPKIIETSDENAATSPFLPIEHSAEEQSSQPQRKVQSMRAKLNSPISPSQDSKRPQFMRQGSRGDVLISRVTSSYKSKVRDLSTLA